MFQILMIQVVKESGEVSNHNINWRVCFDKIEGTFRKMNVTLVQISSIGHSRSGCSIFTYSFVVKCIQKETVILVNASVNVCCVANISCFWFFPLFLAVFDALFFIVDKRVEAMLCNQQPFYGSGGKYEEKVTRISKIVLSSCQEPGLAAIHFSLLIKERRIYLSRPLKSGIYNL